MRVGICSIQRNRGPWILEWVLFHYLLGVRYFYIGIHKTTDHSVAVLEQLSRYINIKTFAVADTTYQAPQQDFYQYTLDRFQHEVDWLAFIDGDEFLFPVKVDTLQEALKQFANQSYSALGVYWRCFGSSGHIKEPKGLILENFKLRAPDNFSPNRHIKSVVRTKHARGTLTLGAHLFETPAGTYDELGRPISGGLSEHESSAECLRINHYVCQSREYFLTVKRPNGSPCRNVTSAEQLRSEVFWEEHDRNDIQCDAIDRFIPKLKVLERSLLKGKVPDERAPDIMTPLSRQLSFTKEMILNVYYNPNFARSRLLGFGIKRIKKTLNLRPIDNLITFFLIAFLSIVLSTHYQWFCML